MKLLSMVSIFTGGLVLILCSYSFASPVDDVLVLKISAQDQRAVIKTSDGKMRIIKVNDSIGEHAKVLEIAGDRVVIAEQKGKETEKVIIRLENGKQRVERLKKTGDAKSQTQAVVISQRPTAKDKQLGKGKKTRKEPKAQKEK